MKFLKNLLRSPIRNTIIVLTISLLVYVLLALISLYVMRIMCASSVDVMETCRGTSLQMFGSTILSDLGLIFRIVAELSIIVLISQLIHRLITRQAK